MDNAQPELDLAPSTEGIEARWYDSFHALMAGEGCFDSITITNTQENDDDA